MSSDSGRLDNLALINHHLKEQYYSSNSFMTLQAGLVQGSMFKVKSSMLKYPSPGYGLLATGY
jgi:hypothetical protein